NAPRVSVGWGAKARAADAAWPPEVGNPAPSFFDVAALAGFPNHGASAGFAKDLVVAATADESVVAVAAEQPVVAVAARDGVVAIAASQPIVAVSAGDGVIARATVDGERDQRGQNVACGEDIVAAVHVDD